MFYAKYVTTHKIATSALGGGGGCEKPTNSEILGNNTGVRVENAEISKLFIVFFTKLFWIVNKK